MTRKKMDQGVYNQLALIMDCNPVLEPVIKPILNENTLLLSKKLKLDEKAKKCLAGLQEVKPTAWGETKKKSSDPLSISTAIRQKKSDNVMRALTIFLHKKIGGTYGGDRKIAISPEEYKACTEAVVFLKQNFPKEGKFFRGSKRLTKVTFGYAENRVLSLIFDFYFRVRPVGENYNISLVVHGTGNEGGMILFCNQKPESNYSSITEVLGDRGPDKTLGACLSSSETTREFFKGVNDYIFNTFERPIIKERNIIRDMRKVEEERQAESAESPTPEQTQES